MREIISFDPLIPIRNHWCGIADVMYPDQGVVNLRDKARVADLSDGAAALTSLLTIMAATFHHY